MSNIVQFPRTKDTKQTCSYIARGMFEEMMKTVPFNTNGYEMYASDKYGYKYKIVGIRVHPENETIEFQLGDYGVPQHEV